MFSDAVQEHIDRVVQEQKEEFLKIAPDIIKDRMQRALDDVGQEWYGEYDPNEYQRYNKNGVFDDAEITVRSNENGALNIAIEYHIHTNHQSEEYVESILDEGYHGGSRGIDKRGIAAWTPKYRYPSPHYRYWGRKAKPRTKLNETGQKEVDNASLELSNELSTLLGVMIERNL